MKNLIIAITILIAAANSGYSQNINWKSLGEEKQNIANLNIGYDYGLTTQIGYSRVLNTFKPIVLSADYSFPMGEKLFDDFKVRYGGQIEIIEINGFSATANVMGNFRRHETEMVRVTSFGSEFSIISGYYKPKWHIAAEFGFDKAISTHLKHSDIMKENYYSAIKDGWFVSTGGNWFYGIQASKTLGTNLGVSFRAGLTNAQGSDVNALLPYYAQVGLVKRF
jgi:hypothetical protein